MSNKVSVVIPTYNRSSLVTEAIDSVLEQSTLVEEIIVVDDGSTDDTSSALSAYGDRITVVRQENSGVNAARNRALELATGSFIALLDNDDVWLPFKTALELAALEAFPDSGFVFSDFYIWKPGISQIPKGLDSWHPKRRDWSAILQERVSGSTLKLNVTPRPEKDFDLYHGDIYGPSLEYPFVLPSTAIIRRECMDDLRFDASDSTCGDWSFFARLSRRFGAVYVDLETTLNRSHEDEVRLTRLDQGVQLERRLNMTGRLWGNDAGFEREHPGRAATMAASLLHQRARVALKSDRPADALAFLDEARALGTARGGADDFLLRFLASTPGVLALAQRAIRFRQQWRG